MKHVTDFPITKAKETLHLRRARLFVLCNQERRAAYSRDVQRDHPASDISDADLEAIRKRAVNSFARPA